MYQVRYKETNIVEGKPYKINVLLSRHKTQAQAETYIGIEGTQMEFAESQGELYIVEEKNKKL